MSTTSKRCEICQNNLSTSESVSKWLDVNERIRQYNRITFQNKEYHKLISGTTSRSSKCEVQTTTSSLRLKAFHCANLAKNRESIHQYLCLRKLITQDFISKRLLDREQLESIKCIRHQILTLVEEDSKVTLLHRMKIAVRMFTALDLKVTLENPQDFNTVDHVQLSGYSSILGIPIPNNGFYDGMPVDLVLAGLIHLTNLIDGLATLFNIPLPNTLLTRETLNTPMLIAGNNGARTYGILPIVYYENSRDTYRSFTASPLNNLLLNKQYKKAEDFDAVQDLTINSEFYSHSMRFLNENVVHLCSILGVADHLLWPNCAAVLNLYRIYDLCLQSTLHFDTSIITPRLEEINNYKDYKEYISKQMCDRYSLTQEIEKIRVEYKLKLQSMMKKKSLPEVLDDWDFVFL